MNHAALIDLYNQIVTHKTDRTVVTQLFDQLCELIVRDYPAPDLSMKAELDTLFNGNVTPSPSFQDVTPALVPLVILRQILKVNCMCVNPNHCQHWRTVASRYKDLLFKSSAHPKISD